MIDISARGQLAIAINVGTSNRWTRERGYALTVEVVINRPTSEAGFQITTARNRMATFVGQSGDTFVVVIYIRVDMIIRLLPMSSVATIVNEQIRH
jgi:hypothetical protein